MEPKDALGATEGAPSAQEKGKSPAGDALGGYKCLVCLRIMTLAVIAHCCGWECCALCAEGLCASGKKCAKCKRVLGPEVSNSFTAALQTRQAISDLVLPCSHAGAGCPERMRFDEIRKHEETCLYARHKCPSARFGCEWEGTAEDMQQHAESCEFVQLAPFADEMWKTLKEAGGNLRGVEEIVERTTKRSAIEATLRVLAVRAQQFLLLGISPFFSPNTEVTVNITERFGSNKTHQRSQPVDAPMESILLHFEHHYNNKLFLSAVAPLSFGGLLLQRHDTLVSVGFGPDDLILLFLEPLLG